MVYYDLSPAERDRLKEKMTDEIYTDISSASIKNIEKYASDADTYIRKNCYLIIGKLYKNEICDRKVILTTLDDLAKQQDEKIRQTAVYALGEIGKIDFDAVEERLDYFLSDKHHSVRNGLTGAIKQMGNKNPGPVFAWVKEKIKTCDLEIIKKIIHGLELRGRTHPEELLPLLKDLSEKNIDKKTREMLVHIVGQISYKKGCLEKVVNELKEWQNKDFVRECQREISEVHRNYAKFSCFQADEAEKYMQDKLKL